MYKGSISDKETKKFFYVQYWYNGKSGMYKLGKVSQTFGVKECDEELLKIYRDHTDPKTGFWTKDPNETKKNDNASQLLSFSLLDSRHLASHLHVDLSL